MISTLTTFLPASKGITLACFQMGVFAALAAALKMPSFLVPAVVLLMVAALAGATQDLVTDGVYVTTCSGMGRSELGTATRFLSQGTGRAWLGAEAATAAPSPLRGLATRGGDYLNCAVNRVQNSASRGRVRQLRVEL